MSREAEFLRDQSRLAKLPADLYSVWHVVFIQCATSCLRTPKPRELDMGENKALINFLEKLELNLGAASKSKNDAGRARTTLALAPESHSQISDLASRIRISKKRTLSLTVLLLQNLLNGSDEIRRITITGIRDVNSENTVRKSYAVSESDRSELAKLSRDYEVPRHGLLERGVDLLELLINLRSSEEDA